MNDYRTYLIRKGRAVKTAERYAKTMEQIKAIQERTGIDLQEMTYNDVLDYLSIRRKQGIKPSTVNKEVIVMRHYFELLIEEEQRLDNPTTGIKIQGAYEQRIEKILTSDELEQLYKSYPDKRITQLRNKVMLGFMVYQGLRTTEIESIHCSDVDLEDCSIFIRSITKSNSRRIPLQTKQLLPLLDYMENKRPKLLAVTKAAPNYLFISTGTSNRLQNVFRKLAAELKQREEKFESWQQLRASVITNKLTPNNVRQVQHYFGMKKVKTAERYQAGSVEDLRSELDRCFSV